MEAAARGRRGRVEAPRHRLQTIRNILVCFAKFAHFSLAVANLKREKGKKSQRRKKGLGEKWDCQRGGDDQWEVGALERAKWIKDNKFSYFFPTLVNAGQRSGRQRSELKFQYFRKKKTFFPNKVIFFIELPIFYRILLANHDANF